jgi:hypothetical protein
LLPSPLVPLGDDGSPDRRRHGPNPDRQGNQIRIHTASGGKGIIYPFTRQRTRKR